MTESDGAAMANKDRTVTSEQCSELLDLGPIKARWEAAKRSPVTGTAGMRLLWESAKDVPALLAEIDRCQKMLGQYDRPRTPICSACRDSICYVPGHGFGNDGEWRHIAPPLLTFPRHEPVPAIFVTPPVTTT